MDEGDGVQDQGAGVWSALPSGQSLPADAWRRRHRGIVRACWASSVVLAVFMLALGDVDAHVLAEAAVPAALGTVAWRAPAGPRWRGAIASLAVMTVAMVAVHATATIEAHFLFFVMVPVIALYEDWVPFATGIAFVVVHHAAATAIDPTAVYNHPAALARPLLWSTVHTLLFAAMCATSIVHWRIHEHARSAQQELTEQVRSQALRDTLTGLANRRLLTDRLAVALRGQPRRGTPVAVLMLDLDGFKPVNDVHGHAVGDELLVVLADRLTACTRPGDTLARLGGDEFAVVLPDTGRDGAEEVARRVVAAAARPVHAGGATVTVGASVGIAVSARADEPPDVLLQRADSAMYAAKRSGRGRWVAWSPGLDLADRDALEVRVTDSRAWAAWIRALRSEIGQQMATGRVPAQSRAPEAVRRTLEQVLLAIDGLPDDATGRLPLPGRASLEEFVFHQALVNDWTDGLVEDRVLTTRRDDASERFWQALYTSVALPATPRDDPHGGDADGARVTLPG